MEIVATLKKFGLWCHGFRPNVPSKLPRPPQMSSSRKAVQAGSSSQRPGITAPSRPSLTKGVTRTASSMSSYYCLMVSRCGIMDGLGT